MKKMTCKEFKAILNNAGMDYETWGWEGILNIISGYNDKCAEDLRKNGLNAAAANCEKISDKIYMDLEMRGYYNK